MKLECKISEVSITFFIHDFVLYINLLHLCLSYVISIYLYFTYRKYFWLGWRWCGRKQHRKPIALKFFEYKISYHFKKCTYLYSILRIWNTIPRSSFSEEFNCRDYVCNIKPVVRRKSHHYVWTNVPLIMYSLISLK